MITDYLSFFCMCVWETEDLLFAAGEGFWDVALSRDESELVSGTENMVLAQKQP